MKITGWLKLKKKERKKISGCLSFKNYFFAITFYLLFQQNEFALKVVEETFRQLLQKNWRLRRKLVDEDFAMN